MDMLRQNPELMRSMLNTMNPQLANNPRMQEVIYQKINKYLWFFQMLTNALPEMTNPVVIQALDQVSLLDLIACPMNQTVILFQINQGYETLRREAPRFWESMGMPSNMGAGMPGMDNNMRQMMQQMG